MNVSNSNNQAKSFDAYHSEMTLGILEAAKRLGIKRPAKLVQINSAATVGPGYSECIIFNGAKTPKGYGIVYNGVKLQGAHRLVLEKKLGRPIAAGMHAAHSCNNPSCINMNHIDEKSPQENINDRVARGRAFNGPKIENRLLSVEDISIIRILISLGMKQKSIAERFDVYPSLISAIKSKRIYRDVL